MCNRLVDDCFVIHNIVYSGGFKFQEEAPKSETEVFKSNELKVCNFNLLISFSLALVVGRDQLFISTSCVLGGSS